MPQPKSDLRSEKLISRGFMHNPQASHYNMIPSKDTNESNTSK